LAQVFERESLRESSPLPENLLVFVGHVKGTADFAKPRQIGGHIK